MKIRPFLTFGMFFALFAPFSKAEPLKVGDKAPEVSGVTDSGETLNLADVYKENKYTLVWFYPKAMTGGCTKQGCSLRDANTELMARGVAIVGVSTDTVAEQKAFREKENFPFPLIADTEKKVGQAFGQAPTGRAAREAFLIKDGQIVYKDERQTDQQAENVLAFIKAQKN